MGFQIREDTNLFERVVLFQKIGIFDYYFQLEQVFGVQWQVVASCVTDAKVFR